MITEKYWSCPSNEQETTISFGRTDALADIWTNDRLMMNKLDKLCETSPDFYKCIDVGRTREKEIMCKRYKIVKSMLSFRTKKTTVILTEEQKERRREQLKALRASNFPNLSKQSSENSD